MNTTIRDTGQVCIYCLAKRRLATEPPFDRDAHHIHQEITDDGNVVAEGCYDSDCKGYWKRTDMWYYLNE
jgi:hypothetical protein